MVDDPYRMLPMQIPTLRNTVRPVQLGAGLRPTVGGTLMQQPPTSTAQMMGARNMYAPQSLQAGVMRQAQQPKSQAELLAAYGLGLKPTQTVGGERRGAGAPAARTGLSGMLPAAGTPEMAGLGAAGRTLMQLGGWQDKPMTLGQILGAGAEKGIEAMQARRDAIAAAEEKKAAAERQAEQDALTKRYREAQIEQMKTQKTGGMKVGTVVKLPLKGDMVQDQMWDGTKFVNRGDPYSRFSPKADTSVTITQEAENESAKALARKSADYTYDQLGKYETQARSAAELVEQYDTIQKTLESNPDLQTGVLQELFLPFQKLAASAGFLNDKELKELQALETMQAKMAYIVPRMREQGSGSTSNFEMGVFKTASPGLGKTRESNLLLAASARQAAQHRMNVQDERRRFVQEKGMLPTSQELGDIVEAKYGSVFKTPFGSSINRKSSDEIDQEFANMFNAGKINAGDVVYMGESNGFVFVTNDILRAAGLI